MTPEEFSGSFTMKPGESPLEVTFFRREIPSEEHTLEKFLEAIKPNDIGWDNPTRQLFWKNNLGKIYVLNFTEMSENQHI